jgi:hypothetical protein
VCHRVDQQDGQRDRAEPDLGPQPQKSGYSNYDVGIIPRSRVTFRGWLFNQFLVQNARQTSEIETRSN